MKALLQLQTASYAPGAEADVSDTLNGPALLVEGAVIPASAMPLWLEWQSFGAWVQEQRQQALAQIEAEAASLREQRWAEINEELASLAGEQQLALCQIQLKALAELEQGLAHWCESFAQQAARHLSDTLLQDEAALARLFAAGLAELLSGLSDSTAVSIHCAAVDQRAIDEALAEGLPAVRMRARVAVDPELTPGRCLLRLGQEAYEIDLPRWLQMWGDQIHSDCASLVAALGLPAQGLQEDRADTLEAVFAPAAEASHGHTDGMADSPGGEDFDTETTQEVEMDDLAWLDEDDMEPDAGLGVGEPVLMDEDFMPATSLAGRGAAR